MAGSCTDAGAASLYAGTDFKGFEIDWDMLPETTKRLWRLRAEHCFLAMIGTRSGEANARLIAAAPRLYAALDALANNAERVEHDYYGLAGCEDFNPQKAIDEALAALAEARGA